MKLHIIFGQRKCRYTGEYAPEALDIADEYTMEENPDWLYNKMEDHRKGGSFESVRIIIVKVGDDKIDKAFATPEIDGEVV